MFGFIKNVFVVAMIFFVCYPSNCVSMNNQECKVRSEIININSNEPFFYETCKCTCRLDASVCNNKQRWNNDKCRMQRIVNVKN